MPVIHLGLNAKMYRGTAGSQAGTEMDNVKDVSISQEYATTDVTVRANSGYRNHALTLKDAEVTFDMLVDDADTHYDALSTAYQAGTALAFYILDEAGGEGLDADFIITNFSKTQGLEDAIMVSVTLKPNCDLRNPTVG